MFVHHIDLQSFTWNKRIFAKVWTSGCNMKCRFCFVPDVVYSTGGISSKEVYEKIKSNRVMDGVCVTGGEPTIWKDLPIFLKRLKLLGLDTMLETNGTNPEMINKLIKRNAIDYIRLDIKGPPEKYKEITGEEFPESVKETLGILEKWRGYWEVTTVWHPLLSRDDLISIGKLVKNRWVILPFETGKLLDATINKSVEFDENFLSSIEGPAEIWVRTREHERRLK